MAKLLLCLLAATVIGAATLQLRRQKIELAHRNSTLNDQINARQAKLWSQQMQIAMYTAPNAIQQTIKGHNLDMTSQSAVPSSRADWINPEDNPDAE